LHLLLKIPGSLKSSKPIRDLIYKGADRDIRNKDGLTPLMLLVDEDYKLQDSKKPGIEPVLKEELMKILGKQPLYIPCIHFTQPLETLKKSRKTMLFYFFSVLVIETLFVLFIYPYTNSAWLVTSGSLAVLQYLFFFLASCKNPGTVSKSKKISFLKLN